DQQPRISVQALQQQATMATPAKRAIHKDTPAQGRAVRRWHVALGPGREAGINKSADRGPGQYRTMHKLHRRAQKEKCSMAAVMSLARSSASRLCQRALSHNSK